MKVLLIQLCRMGDVIQTLPLVEALIGRGDEVHLLIRESMRELPLGRRGLRLHYISVPVAEGDGTAGGALDELLSDLAGLEVELSINLSFDETGALIATYLTPPTSLGLTMGRDRRTRALDPWTQYLLSVPENRRHGAFNLAQVYGHLAGAEIGPEHVAVCNGSLACPDSTPLGGLKAIGKPNPRIGLVPGASDVRKRWPALRFAELADRLTSEGHPVCLLGSPDEQPLGAEIRAALRPPGDADLVYDWIGQTGLQELCSVLSTLDLVVTNDTGTMHLAAALGVTTLAVTLGPAHVFESAPFAPNHFTIESTMPCHPCEFSSHCADTACGPAIPSDVVLRVALHALGARAMSRAEPDERYGIEPAEEPLHRTFVSQFDERGRLYPTPWHRPPLSTTELMRSLYESLWEQSLNASRSRTSSAEIAESLAERWDVDGARELSPELAGIGATLDDYIRTVDRSARELLEINGSGSEDSDRLEALTTELEERIELLGSVEPHLAPLTTFTLTQLSMAGGRNPAHALTDMLMTLSSALDRGRLLAESMDQTTTALVDFSSHCAALVPGTDSSYSSSSRARSSAGIEEQESTHGG